MAMLCDARDHASPSQHASATRVKRYTCQSWAPKVRERCGWAAGKRDRKTKKCWPVTVTVVGEMVHLNIHFPSPKPKLNLEA